MIQPFNNMTRLEAFSLIGISVRTTNQNGQSAQDLGLLWNRFFAENIAEKVPDKRSDDICVVYTDYETDHTGPYTAFIGLRTGDTAAEAEGLTLRHFPAGAFRKFTAAGKMPDAVIQTWMDIWERNDELNRAYTFDLEVYGPRAQNGEQSEVDIFLSVR